MPDNDLMTRLERAARFDLNRDRRIGTGDVVAARNLRDLYEDTVGAALGAETTSQAEIDAAREEFRAGVVDVAGEDYYERYVQGSLTSGIPSVSAIWDFGEQFGWPSYDEGGVGGNMGPGENTRQGAMQSDPDPDDNSSGVDPSGRVAPVSVGPVVAVVAVIVGIIALARGDG